tara:strand:- start:631 stop:807 length:177 start_codon:yes stop_codon:yes gene_type:complete
MAASSMGIEVLFHGRHRFAHFASWEKLSRMRSGRESVYFRSQQLLFSSSLALFCKLGN